MMSIDARIAIVGGGLAGILTAAALLEQGVDDFVLVEREASLGGVARTIRRAGFELEPGAGTLLLPKPDLSALLEVLGVDVVPSPEGADSRYVVLGRELVEIPTSPKALFAPVMGVGAKLRAAMEPFVASGANGADETLHDFLTRRLGTGAGSLLAWLGASGVFAGDPKELSAAAAFPLFPELEAEGGSIVRGALGRRRRGSSRPERPRSHVPVGGMSAIGERAAALLGDRALVSTDVTSIRPEGGGWIVGGARPLRVEQVVVATPRPVAARLLGGDLGAVLGRTTGVAETAVVGLGWLPGEATIPNGFGALIGPDEELLTRGVLFESSYAPARVPQGATFVKAIAGGPGVRCLPSEDELLRTVVCEEVVRILGIESPPDVEFLVRHPRGVPQYTVGHRAWLSDVDRLTAQLDGLHLTGWEYRGVGVAHLATEALRVVSRIAAQALAR